MQGWAFYNGELRHGSNSSGSKYGKPLNEGDLLGVLFDSEKVGSYNFVPVSYTHLTLPTKRIV